MSSEKLIVSKKLLVVIKKVVIKKTATIAPTECIPVIHTQKKKVVTKKAVDKIENKLVTIKKTADKKPRVVKKKEYTKVGQTKPTPPITDPLYKFYTSLLREKPNSEMAMKWCTERGLVPNQPDV